MNKTPKINDILLFMPICLAISMPAIAEDTIKEDHNSQNFNAVNFSVQPMDKQSSDSQTFNSQNTSHKHSIEPNSFKDDASSITDLNDEATEWADNRREEVQDTLGSWAHSMNRWFGEPNPNMPASANLRLVLDTRWANDPVEGNNWTVKPRVRGRLRLPVLEQKLSVIIGDEDLDEEVLLRQDTGRYASSASKQGNHKTFDGKRARDDNASVALRWSKIEEALDFDADIGIRSGDDLYLKFSMDKTWYKQDKMTVTNHNYYRYGTDSRHTVKGEINAQYAVASDRFINNNISIRYRNRKNKEETTWSNELRQVHLLGNNKQLSYGLSTFGYLDSDKPTLNSYGPAVSYRQPFWRDWLFLQSELSYFNDKRENKEHFPSALIRFEALF